MEHALQPLLLFFMCMTISYAADFLQNPDFEIPPANATAYATSQFLLTEANSIPGWSFNGTVSYITSDGNSSISGSRHAVQLGQNGKINQTIRATGEVYDYILGFTLAAQSEDCANNHTSVNVSVHERSVLEISRVFSLQRNSSRKQWERHALYLGRLGGADSVNIEIESVATNSEDNLTSCWPVVDTFTVNRNGMPRWYDGNMLANGDFEVGPAFLKNSSEGIILNEELDIFSSPLQEWSILGTVRYIDYKHYKAPQGKAAVELVSGAPSGIQVDLILPMTLTYTLNFTIGDANDSCVGDFRVYVQVGLSVHNFTMQSNGTGSASNHSITFKSESSRETSISLYSFNKTRSSSDGVLCGPVLDNLVLFGSYGERRELCNGVLVFGLLIAFVILVA